MDKSRKILRILLLEDNPADAELIQFELEDGGVDFTAMCVMREADYVAALQHFSPHIILSDYDLPSYSGSLALAEAKKRCPDVPFILVTGAVSEERAIEILTSGAKDYVMKNRLTRLVPAVRRALAEAEEHRARKRAEAELRAAHRELEDEVKKRNAELQAVLDTAPFAIWIAHDPECRRITGNLYADKVIMRTARGGNISRSATPGEEAVSYKVFRDGVELSPAEMPAHVAAGTGRPVPGTELELVFPDGRRVHMITGAVPLFDADGVVRGAVTTGADVSKRKEAEERLRQNEERQRLVMQASSIGTFEIDLSTGETNWNATVYELLGLKPGETPADQETFFRFVHPDDVGRLQEQWVEAMLTGKLDAEFRTVGADGRERWLASRGEYLFAGGSAVGDHTGDRKALRFMGVNFDITERKQMEAALRQNREAYRELVENAGSVILRTDRETRITFMNRYGLAFFGYTAEEIIGKRALGTIIPAKDEQGRDVAGMIQNLMERPEEYPATVHQNMCKDGRLVWMSWTNRPVYDEHGNFAELLAIGNDISRLKEAEETAQQSKEQYDMLFNRLIEGFCVAEMIFDRDGRAVDFRLLETNPAFEKQTGITGAKGKRLLELVPDIERHWFDTLGQVVLTGKPRRFENEARALQRWYEVFAQRVGGPDSCKVAIFFNDITKRKRAEEELKGKADQLEEINRELESFSYSVSHDLRAPLRAIDGYTRIIGKKLQDRLDDDTRRQFNQVRESARSMGQLIDDLLTFSRLGNRAIKSTTIDMGQLIEEVWREQQNANAARRMVFKLNPLPAARADRILVKQAVTNILANAVKFTARRDEAQIEAGGFAKDGENIYYVKDNGVGFDMQYHDKMFGVFQRLHSDEYDGTGIGLALVQRIVHRHGGKVWADGRVDEGATFYFVLPAAD